MARRPLGRGLDALIGSTSAEPANGNDHGRVGVADGGAPALTMIRVEWITPSPFQPRRNFDPERLKELADAIRSQGVIEPLIVRRRPGDLTSREYELVAGERRLRAAREAGLEHVPVVVRDLDDRGALEMSLVENLSREDLNAVEEARAFVRLSKEFALSHDEIAARIGKSRSYVTNTLRLLELAASVLEMIASGQLTAGQARPLLRLPAAEQIEAARRIVEGRISARGAEQIASAHRPVRGGGAIRSSGDANLNALAESIQRALKRKVRIVRCRGKTPGRIEIEYYNDEDLTGVARMLVGSGFGGSAART
jgi:ParB family transcriptional regulator, chromosome partitioning protein